MKAIPYPWFCPVFSKTTSLHLTLSWKLWLPQLKHRHTGSLQKSCFDRFYPIALCFEIQVQGRFIFIFASLIACILLFPIFLWQNVIRETSNEVILFIPSLAEQVKEEQSHFMQRGNDKSKEIRMVSKNSGSFEQRTASFPGCMKWNCFFLHVLRKQTKESDCFFSLQKNCKEDVGDRGFKMVHIFIFLGLEVKKPTMEWNRSHFTLWTLPVRSCASNDFYDNGRKVDPFILTKTGEINYMALLQPNSPSGNIKQGHKSHVGNADPIQAILHRNSNNDKIFAQRHAGTRHSSLHEKVSKFYLRRTVFLRVQLATWGAARVPNTHGEPVLLDPSASKEFCALKQDEKCAVVLFSFHLSGGPFFCGRILHTVGESKIQCMVGRVMLFVNPVSLLAYHSVFLWHAYPRFHAYSYLNFSFRQPKSICGS